MQQITIKSINQTPIPCFDVPTYSISVNNGIHFSFFDDNHEMFYHDSNDDSLFSADIAV